MKTMRLGKYFLSIATMAFLFFSTGNAFGVNATRNCDITTGASGSGCTGANNYMVMAPYWQVDSGSYTFIAVTHTSLSGMASQIGLHVNAMKSNGQAYNTAATFTVAAGVTERLFIVPTGHATVNSASIPTGKFIVGTTDYTYGSVIVEPVMTHPRYKYANNIHSNVGAGFRDITMLSYWGSVIIEANTTGFAMEFLGDMNDSTALPENNTCWYGDSAATTSGKDGAIGCATKPAYRTMSSGPNLQ